VPVDALENGDPHDLTSACARARRASLVGSSSLSVMAMTLTVSP
jgi:hypothetical protein